MIQKLVSKYSVEKSTLHIELWCWLVLIVTFYNVNNEVVTITSWSYLQDLLRAREVWDKLTFPQQQDTQLMMEPLRHRIQPKTNMALTPYPRCTILLTSPQSWIPIGEAVTPIPVLKKQITWTIIHCSQSTQRTHASVITTIQVNIIPILYSRASIFCGHPFIIFQQITNSSEIRIFHTTWTCTIWRNDV